MLLRWNENRVLYIPLVKRYDEAEFAKMSEDAQKKAVRAVGALSLLTGINEVSDADWALALPDVGDKLKRKANEIDPKLSGRKALEIVTFTTGTAKGINTFTKVPASQCRKLLAETFSAPTLQLWEQTEVRESVRVDIKKRMTELGVEPAKDDLLANDDDDETYEEDEREQEDQQPGKAPVPGKKQQPKK